MYLFLKLMPLWSKECQIFKSEILRSVEFLGLDQKVVLALDPKTLCLAIGSEDAEQWIKFPICRTQIISRIFKKNSNYLLNIVSFRNPCFFSCQIPYFQPKINLYTIIFKLAAAIAYKKYEDPSMRQP